MPQHLWVRRQSSLARLAGDSPEPVEDPCSICDLSLKKKGRVLIFDESCRDTCAGRQLCQECWDFHDHTIITSSTGEVLNLGQATRCPFCRALPKKVVKVKHKKVKGGVRLTGGNEYRSVRKRKV